MSDRTLDYDPSIGVVTGARSREENTADHKEFSDILRKFASKLTHKMIAPDIEQKYTDLAATFPPAEVEKWRLHRAFELVNCALAGRVRENGDPFIFHALDVAQIVALEVGLGVQAAAAVLLHEADCIAPVATAELVNTFGKETADIVESLHKISRLDLKTTGLQAEAFRKLIVSYSTNPQVIVIKLADRLEVMRSLSFFPKSKHAKKSAETLLLYVPLAHKLGLYKLKSELEDLSLRYAEPVAYRDIAAKLHLTENSRSKLVDKFVAPIKKELEAAGLKFYIKRRTKSVYSIWNKMQKQGVPFEKVYDVFAIRIILNSKPESEKEDCWKAYSVVTSRYEPDVRRLRDWITVPKPNGYESLHTTVKVDNGHNVEVQIRTERMDDYAEHGMAAHWRYKGLKQEQGGVEEWLNNIRKLLESTPAEEDLQKRFTPNEVFVFTPTGDLRQLPAGATVLDFAFDIHSNLGCRCMGAVQNGKHVSIREVLKTGDTVAIITSKNQTPNLDWLSYVVTSKAKQRIKYKLREDEARVAALGKEALERKLKNWKTQLVTDAVTALTKYFKFKTATELYVKLALEELDFALVSDALAAIAQGEKQPQSTPQQELPKQAKAAEISSDYIVVDEKLSNVEYKFAKCCSPIYGDDVFGFITVGNGITIHRTSCPNAERLISQFGYRVINAKWRKQEAADSFQAIIKIVANDEVGLQHKLAEAVNAAQGVIRSMQLLPSKGVVNGQIQVYVKNAKQLEMLLFRLSHLKGVQKAVRVGS
ncbi:MAG: RelA/SpoT family protein [Prevotellaceae bacterium]|nr:RelA/SpoT family protein [Prevotellaceae bacterium]